MSDLPQGDEDRVNEPKISIEGALKLVIRERSEQRQIAHYIIYSVSIIKIFYNGEFDPGSG